MFFILLSFLNAIFFVYLFFTCILDLSRSGKPMWLSILMSLGFYLIAFLIVGVLLYVYLLVSSQ